MAGLLCCRVCDKRPFFYIDYGNDVLCAVCWNWARAILGDER